MILFCFNQLFNLYSVWIHSIVYFCNDNFHYTWAILCMKWFNNRIFLKGEQTLYTDKPCIYFTNHRCQADFFIDQILTQGRSIFLSRFMVGVFAFMYFPVSFLGGSILFFNRKGGRNKIYDQVDIYHKNSPYPCILLYPEGTRNQQSTSLKLKTGFIRYAFDRKIPIQIFITRNKEEVLCLQSGVSNYNTKLITSYAKVIDSTDYTSYQQFEDKIKTTWDEIWHTVYNTPNDKLIEYNFIKANYFHPKKTIWNILGFYLCEIFMMMIFLYLNYKFPISLLYSFIPVAFEYFKKKKLK